MQGRPKYRDILIEIGTEEIGHVEILTLITQLMDKAPLQDKEAATRSSAPSWVARTRARRRGARFDDATHGDRRGRRPEGRGSSGSPWSGAFVVASGNLLADFRDNLTKESQ